MRITLRKLKKGDLHYFLKWWRDDEIIALTSGIREDSMEVLHGYFYDLLNFKNDNHFMVSVDGNAVGHIALNRKGKTAVEIHIAIGEKNFWGKGIGPVAISKATKIAFEKLDLKKITLEVRPDNLRAIRAYEKCGFKKGKLKFYKDEKQPINLEMVLMKKDVVA